VTLHNTFLYKYCEEVVLHYKNNDGLTFVTTLIKLQTLNNVGIKNWGLKKKACPQLMFAHKDENIVYQFLKYLTHL
jgi:hypothetical protein